MVYRMLQGTYNEADLISSTLYPTDESCFASTPGQSPNVERGVDVRYSDEEELWFDWIADTGDGSNSTYTIARSLAQPKLETKADGYSGNKLFQRLEKSAEVKGDGEQEDEASLKDDSFKVTLPRGKFFVIGGDLAYPTANEEEYNRRFFRPFEYALESPANSEGMQGMSKF